jgi:catechol 2,3-dioxygenase-like lactoylglutathione lyase family enzyme
MTPRPRLLSTTPVLVVSDLQRALDFYCRKLGFDEPNVWGEPPCFAMLHRDGFELMLSLAEGGHRPTPNGPASVWDVYVRVPDVAAEIAALGEAGVPLAKGPTDLFYGMREIEVLDPDGYRWCFGQDTTSAATEVWDGVLDVGKSKLRLRLKLRTEEDGTLHGVVDSLDQNAMNLPIDVVTRSGTALRFEMKALQAVFEGVTSADGKSVEGRWTQRGQGWPLVFRRG